MKREFVTGLILRNRAVEWTTLRRVKTGIETLESRTATLELNDEDLANPEKLAAELNLKCATRDSISLGLPADRMLMLVTELPIANPDEMAGMIQLQMDKCSPFPEDRMASAYEILKETDTTSRVLIVAVQRDWIESVGAVFKKAGFRLQRLDAEIMGWWRLLKDAALVAETDRRLILILNQGNGLMIAVQDGAPIAFRTLGSSEGLSSEEYAGEVIRDISDLLLSLDVEYGALGIPRFDIFHRDADPQELSRRLRDEFNRETQIQSLDTFPPVCEGLARRALDESGSRTKRSAHPFIDLTPMEWRKTEADRQTRRGLIKASIVFLSAWLAVGVILGGCFGYQQYRLHRLEKEFAALQTPADEVRQLQRHVKTFELYLDRRHSALECLREVIGPIPKDVNLTIFQFRKGKSVVVRGEALTVNPIYDFKQALDKSELFSGMEMGTVQPNKRKDTTVQSFQITARLGGKAP